MTTPKNQALVFNKFLRKYHDALAKLQITQSISTKDTHKILSFLGYVDNLINDQTLQLCHTISYMLSPQKDCKITRRNLFEFLRVISDIKSFSSNVFYQQARPLQNEQQSFGDQPLVCLRIGSFNQNSQWTLNPTQETQVKNIFGFMNLNRISHQHIKAEQKDISQIFEQQTFQPQILHKSKQLAQKRSKRVSLSNSKVQQRLLQSHSLQKSKLQEKVRRSVQKQMRQCPFKPKINRKSVSIVNSSIMYKFVDSMDNSFENRQNVLAQVGNVNNMVSNDNSLQHQLKASKLSQHERIQYNSIVSRNSLATRYINNSNNNSVINNNNNNSLQKSFGTNKVQTKLLNKGKQYQQRLSKLADQYKQMSDQMHMKECTFQPRININNNRNFNNINNKNSNKQNNPSNNISRLSSSKLSSSKFSTNNNRHNSNTTTHPTSNPTPIRNAQQSIQRMKQARRIRQFQNQVKQRGYPKNIAWTKYINNNKSSIINEFNNNVSIKSPILCIDLKIMQSTKNLKVYQGQCLAEISQSICVDNSVPFQHWGKVQELLRNSIELCNEVRICDNKVYLRGQ